jgi:hypothetical protein
LRQNAIRGGRGTGRRHPLHVFLLLQTRRALGLLQACAVPSDLAAGQCRDVSLGQQDSQASLLRECGCGTYSESPDWSTGKPNFDKMKVGVNAWLFDDFDPLAVPLTVIDGRNLW